MADLWDTLTPDSTTNTMNSTEMAHAVATMTPDQMVTYDLNTQELVQADTQLLRESLEFCQHIVIAAYTVADYVPNLSNNQHTEFWKEKVSRSHYSYFEVVRIK